MNYGYNGRPMTASQSNQQILSIASRMVFHMMVTSQLATNTTLTSLDFCTYVRGSEVFQLLQTNTSTKFFMDISSIISSSNHTLVIIKGCICSPLLFHKLELNIGEGQRDCCS